MDPTSTADALEAMSCALASIEHAERRRLDHATRLALVERARTVVGRAEALLTLLVAEADKACSAAIVKGTSTASWLQSSGTVSKGEAAGLVFSGRDLLERPGVRDAALAGEVSVKQARSIAHVMGALAVGLTAEERGRAETLLLAEASSTDAPGLARLGGKVLAAVAPDAVEGPEGEQRRLEAQQRRARAARTFSMVDDGDGSYVVSGSLPHLAAEPLRRLLQAKVDATRRAEQDLPTAERSELTVGQRWADALVGLAAEVASGGARVPKVAGDRPRVVVTMSYDALREQAEQAGVLAEGQPIGAGDLRRLCCDADLVPVVLGSGSELLDHGSTVRLVPDALRRALSLRDGGCTFPGCEAPDTRCEAHHIIPFGVGGPTSLANLVLLCPHHHGLCEPPRFFAESPPDRWSVRLDGAGFPEFLPPRSVDPARVPRRPTGVRGLVRRRQ